MARLIGACAAFGATLTWLGLYGGKGMDMVVGGSSQPLQPALFRLGSGARVSKPWRPTDVSDNNTLHRVLTKSGKVNVQHFEGRMLRGESRNAESKSMYSTFEQESQSVSLRQTFGKEN